MLINVIQIFAVTLLGTPAPPTVCQRDGGVKESCGKGEGALEDVMCISTGKYFDKTLHLHYLTTLCSFLVWPTGFCFSTN